MPQARMGGKARLSRARARAQLGNYYRRPPPPPPAAAPWRLAETSVEWAFRKRRALSPAFPAGICAVRNYAAWCRAFAQEGKDGAANRPEPDQGSLFAHQDTASPRGRYPGHQERSHSYGRRSSGLLGI